MAVQTGEIAKKTMTSHLQSSLRSFAAKAWRLAIVVLLGVGLWLGLRWITSAPPMPVPVLESFWADGGGGTIEVWGLFAPPEYFRLTQEDPVTLDLDPSRELIFFLLIDTHEHDEILPDPATWWDGVSLSINGKGDYRPARKNLVLDSEHHQTVVLAFPRDKAMREAVVAGDNALRLVVPNLERVRTIEWYLPLATSVSPAPGRFPAFLGALLPALAGLLVAFSPCLVHMGSYYAPLFGALKEREVASMAMKVKAAWAAGLFALGFTIPYSVAGMVMGYAGQFARNSSLLGVITQPVTIISGAMVIYFGLQVAEVFQIPFLARLKMPMLRPSSSGYLSSALLGMNLAVGCLGCVGGSLFAGMLLYSGAVGSPLKGGLTLFLFGLAANVPFFVAAITLGRFQLRQFVPLRVTRYIPVISGAILITLGLLILSGTVGVVEQALQQALGIRT